MPTECKGCEKEILDGMYCNSEAGISLCEECSAKVTKHFIDGYYALAEIEYRTLGRTKAWVSHLIKTQFPNAKEAGK